jgi:hypothetical protein
VHMVRQQVSLRYISDITSSFFLALTKPRGMLCSNGTVKPFLVSLVEPVAYLKSELKRRRAAVMSEHDLKPDDPFLVSKVAMIDDEIEYCTRNIESTVHPLARH